jgi:signal transduction histidine kinase
MNESQVGQIFNRFTRINTDQEGQGLGLAIVDSIAHFHHIDIEVASIPNEGTTFTLLLSNSRKLN